MARFLIEVPHEEETVACARVVEIFLKTGSHFVTHTDWGAWTGITEPGSSWRWTARRRPAAYCRRLSVPRPGSWG